MASPVNLETSETHGGGIGASVSELDDLAELESEVKLMAERIVEYRANLPEQFRSTLASILSDQRPFFPNFDNGWVLEGLSGLKTLTLDVEQCSRSSIETSLAFEEQDSYKLNQLKDNISFSLSEVPIITTKMKECVAAMGRNLDSSSGTIHRAFKRARA